MGWVVGASPEIDQQSRWLSITITTLVFTTLMIMVVALRFWVRRRILHREDWVTFGTMFFSIFYSASVIVQTRYGLGLPLALQPPQNWRIYSLTNYASRPFYLFGLAGFKLALCISYLRMTKGSSGHNYRRIIIAVAVFSTVSHMIFVLLYLGQCVPFSKILDRSAIGQCLPFAPLNYSISVVVILCNIIIFLLPMPLINRLHLERSVKLGLIIVFALGLLTTVLSIMRASQIHRIAYVDGDSSFFVIRSGLELNIGIITSCLPVLRPVLRLIPRKIISLLPIPSTTKAAESSLNGEVELRESYPALPIHNSNNWLKCNSSHNSLWADKSKNEVVCTTVEETDDNDSTPSRNASTVATLISQPERALSRQHDHRRTSVTARSIISQAATTRSILSQAATTRSLLSASSEAVIKGGGRQRWEQADGSGRWEGFGGVIKTIELEVSSEVATPTSTTGAGEFGRGLTRRDDWDDGGGVVEETRERAGSRMEVREDKGG